MDGNGYGPVILFCLMGAGFVVAAFVVLPRILHRHKTGLGTDWKPNYYSRFCHRFGDGTNWSEGYRIKWPKTGRW